jgi:hypothetical protein
MSFTKNKFVVIKQVISPELTDFIYKYFLMKRTAAYTLHKNNYFTDEKYYDVIGSWNDPQVPNAYFHYSDIVMETLLLKVHPVMEKITKLKLYPSYSYARIYNKGNILKKHTDRPSCEISTTINLGGDPWPIYIKKQKNIKVDLNPGDMLVYRGCDLEHWRDEFKGEHCSQVFLHYKNKKTKNSKKNLFDGRRHLGLPKNYENNR